MLTLPEFSCVRSTVHSFYTLVEPKGIERAVRCYDGPLAANCFADT